MMFSSHIGMIYKNSALKDIFVKLLFVEYRLSKKIPLTKKWWVSTFQQIVEFDITNFGSIITKGAKPLISGYLLGYHQFTNSCLCANNRGTNKLIVELKEKSKNSTTRVANKNYNNQSIMFLCLFTYCYNLVTDMFHLTR